MRCLMISGGSAEDQVACRLYDQLKRLNSEITVSVWPLFGSGFSFRAYGVPFCCEGFQGFSLFFNVTFFRSLLGYIVCLWRLWCRRKDYDCVICVGRRFALLTSVLVGCRRIYYLPIFASGGGYYFFPMFFYVVKAFVRVSYLPNTVMTALCQNRGIRCMFLGNPLFEDVSDTTIDVGFAEDDVVVAFLPGAREEAYDAFLYFLNLALDLDKTGVFSRLRFIMSKAPHLSLERLLDFAKQAGWVCGSRGSLLCFKKEGVEIVLSEDLVGVIKAASVVVGVSVTACERALDLAKPVVSFPGFGDKIGYRRLKLDQAYVGDWLHVLPQRSVSYIIMAIQRALDVVTRLETPLQPTRLASEGIASHLLGDFQSKTLG
ncbi:MAG: hypothetical protein VW378_07935 [bacterium]